MLKPLSDRLLDLVSYENETRAQFRSTHSAIPEESHVYSCLCVFAGVKNCSLFIFVSNGLFAHPDVKVLIPRVSQKVCKKKIHIRVADVCL